MNFLKCNLALDGNPALRLNNGSHINLPNRLDFGSLHDVVLGVRPQDITLDPLNGTPATLKVIEPTGADTHVLVGLAG
jgi:multiple sugar transport system ATP-binding protein